MIKSELVARLAERNPHLYLRDVELAVSAVFEQISAALARGDRVKIRGFGSFSVRHRVARVGRNPSTGERVDVAAKAMLYFRTGRRLYHRLNDAEDTEGE